MKITSPAFLDSEMIPSIYTCDADNFNPPLEISEVPEGTKSLVLIMDDPDAPRETFTHWLMWNIPPNTKIIEENDWLDGAEQGMNDAGELGYLGPCPPEGVHHYHFKLYALNTVLFFDASQPVNKSSTELHTFSNVTSPAKQVDKKMIEDSMQGHILEKAELVGLYSK